MDFIEPVPAVTLRESLKVRPLRRIEYDHLIELGVFGNEKVELLNGILVPMSPQGNRHALVIEVLTELFVTLLHRRARVRVQLPFAASAIAEPEPDIAIVPADEPRTDHPSRALLVIEVADSSLDYDMDKAPIYAAADVAEYWIIDVNAEAVTVHSGRESGKWTHVNRHGRGETLSLREFPDVKVPLIELFPRP